MNYNNQNNFPPFPAEFQNNPYQDMLSPFNNQKAGQLAQAGSSSQSGMNFMRNNMEQLNLDPNASAMQNIRSQAPLNSNIDMSVQIQAGMHLPSAQIPFNSNMYNNMQSASGSGNRNNMQQQQQQHQGHFSNMIPLQNRIRGHHPSSQNDMIMNVGQRHMTGHQSPLLQSHMIPTPLSMHQQQLMRSKPSKEFYSHDNLKEHLRVQQPRWICFPQLHDTLYHRQRQNHSFANGSHNKSFNLAEKDMHKNLCNRISNMCYKKEESDYSSDLSNNGRYVSIDAMDVKLSSADSKKKYIQFDSICGNASSMNFRGYDLDLEHLVHIRIIIDSTVIHYLHTGDTHFNSNFRRMSDTYQRMSHPGIVAITDIFVACYQKALCICLVSEFIPSVVHMSYFFSSDENRSKVTETLPNGETKAIYVKDRKDFKMCSNKKAYDYFLQLLALCNVLHSKGLPCGMMDPTKVLVQEGRRIYLSSVGAKELYQFKPDEPEELLSMKRIKWMKADLRDLGKLMFALCCGSLTVLMSQAMDQLGRQCMLEQFDGNFVSVIFGLLDDKFSDLNGVIDAYGRSLVEVFESQLQYIHNLESYAMKETLNGRLFRLATKLNMVAHKTPIVVAERIGTGEEMTLNLFSDFVYHQQLPDCQPFIDMGHVVTCLLKLEACSKEKISLVTTSSHVMIVSYADINLVLDKEFSRLKEQFQCALTK